jgi:LPS-assembly protein
LKRGGLAVGVLWILHSAAQAQSDPLLLRISPLLEERISPRQDKEGAIFVTGQRLIIQPDLNTVIEGQARLRKPGLSVRADRLEYEQGQDTIAASGGIQINKPGSQFQGSELKLQVDSFQGALNQPTFEILAMVRTALRHNWNSLIRPAPWCTRPLTPLAAERLAQIGCLHG